MSTFSGVLPSGYRYQFCDHRALRCGAEISICLAVYTPSGLRRWWHKWESGCDKGGNAALLEAAKLRLIAYAEAQL